MQPKMANALLVPPTLAQEIRSLLENENLWNDQYRMVKDKNSSCIALPIREGCEGRVQQGWPQYSIAKMKNLPLSKQAKAKFMSPAQALKRNVVDLCNSHGLCKEPILCEIPSKWERHGDLILLPVDAFRSPKWAELGDQLWLVVAKALSCQRLARSSPIKDDSYRSSGVQLLLGDSGIVTHIDNGIKYRYDVTKCMFSSGNITEKLRVGKLDCTGEVVVDLFAGIGYFTLPYLVHSGAAHVHACEWNPAALEALCTNLELNWVAHKCTVHQGDNRKLELTNIADRVNLGLIPSSEMSWPMAVQVLKPSGGTLHVHGLVSTDISLFKETAAEVISIGDNCPSVSQADSCGVDGAQIDQRHSEETPCSHHDSISSSQNNQKHSEADWPVMCCDKSTNRESFKKPCKQWSVYVSEKILGLLREKGGEWQTKELHLELVKSYAPHVLHVVLDLECRPKAVNCE